MSQCRHAIDIGHRAAVRCALGLYGGQPHRSVCKVCSHRNRPRGLGDLLAIIFARLGITRLVYFWQRVTGKPCGCDRRRSWLNKLFTFKGTP